MNRGPHSVINIHRDVLLIYVELESQSVDLIIRKCSECQTSIALSTLFNCSPVDETSEGTKRLQTQKPVSVALYGSGLQHFTLHECILKTIVINLKDKRIKQNRNGIILNPRYKHEFYTRNNVHHSPGQYGFSTPSTRELITNLGNKHY